MGDAQHAFGVDQAILVIQVRRCHSQIDTDARPPQQRAALVVQTVAGDGQLLRGLDGAFVLIAQQAVDGHVEIAITEQHTRTAVIQARCTNLQRSSSDLAFDRGQRVVDFQGEFLITEQLATVVVQRLGEQIKGLFAGNLTIAVVHIGEIFQRQLAPRIDEAVLVIQRTAVQVEAQVALAEQLATLLVEPRILATSELAAPRLPAVLVT